MKPRKARDARGRRSFLATAAAATLFTLMPEILRTPGASAATDPMDELWRDPANARIVGRRYLAMQPDDNAADSLLEDLVGNRADHGEITAEDLRCAVAERRRQDFASGNTVIVDGWVLSRTEARLCALSVSGRR